ncbi:hypothetical protein [Nocardia jejuensis]|uniref:hypothetical protein n=1 Tax=Nocardia jejuensis TaxID=328049 RepID=UPI000AFBF503|nr:hypothetical protein [Nocardia jejuensis]
MAVMRKFAALSVLPTLLVAGQGLAAAEPAQPESTVLPDTAADPAAAQSNPHALRVGADIVQLPDFVDSGVRDQAQAGIDTAQWQIATTYDNLGFPANSADRRTASTILGGVAGAYVGKVLLAAPLGLAGCALGMAVGGIAGAVIGGAPTVGVGAPLGAVVGGLAGCTIGGLLAFIPSDAFGLIPGAIIGGAAGGALGAGVDVPAPGTPPVAEVSASIPNTEAVRSEPAASIAAQQISAAVDTVAACGPVGANAVSSLRGALDAMPALGPEVPAPVAEPINALFTGLRAAL